MKRSSPRRRLYAPLLASFAALTAAAGQAADGIVVSSGLRYDQRIYLGTHNSYANPGENFGTLESNQGNSTVAQLNAGVRYINPDIWVVKQTDRDTLTGAVLGWTSRVYDADNNTKRVGNVAYVVDWDKRSKSVVVAHNPWDSGYLLMQIGKPFRTLNQWLGPVVNWVRNHRTVITIDFESNVSSSHQSLVEAAYRSSGAEYWTFYPDRENPRLAAPLGRPGGWDIRKYGYPTQAQLLSADYRIVRLPDDWEYQSNTVYGKDSLDSDTWTNARNNEINDFTKELFLMEHAPDFGLLQLFNGKNDISELNKRWDDLRERWDRLPNYLVVDWFHTGDGNPYGPGQFVNERNQQWASLPQITPTVNTFPAATPFGWHNTNVDVSMGGTGDTIRSIVSRSFGRHTESWATRSALTVTAEGISTVSFAAIGGLGNRSDQRLLDVRLDRTLPEITGAVDRAPNQFGWYNADVTATFQASDVVPVGLTQDEISGLDTFTDRVVLSTEGANQSIIGSATDRAGNTQTYVIQGINLDKAGPMMSAAPNKTQIWPPNGKMVPIIITGSITDSLSGVNRDTLTYRVVDEYGQVEPAGRLPLSPDGAYRLPLQLQARRLGTDKDGRHYTIQFFAHDKAGNPSTTSTTVVVPHNQ